MLAVAGAMAVSVGCQPATGFEPTPPLGPVKEGLPLPAEPSSPNAPRLTPCPSGWREVGTAPVACEPWPDGGAQVCADQEAHFAGEPGCARVGTACPTGDFPEGLPVDRPVLYVLQAAAPGGDGSRATPFASLIAALGVAGPSTIIALGRGTYTTDGPLPAQTTVWGACVASTTLTAPSSTTHPAVAFSVAPGVEVRNLRVTGPRIGLAAAGPRGQLKVQDVVVDAATSVGWLAESGGVTTGKNVVIRNTAAGANGKNGHGLRATGGGAISAERLLVDQNHDAAVFASGSGTRVTLVSTAIRRTIGLGVDVESGAQASLERSVVELSRRVGVLAVEGGVVDLTDVVVRDTELDQEKGHGVNVSNGTVTATRLRVERNQGYGVLVGGPQATLTLLDAVVQETRYAAGAGAGIGVAAGVQGVLTVERAHLAHNVGTGLQVGSPGTTAEVTDLVVTDTESNPDGTFGMGLSVMGGARANVHRAALINNRAMGWIIGSPGTAVLADDVVIRSTRASGLGEGGGGLSLGEGATATIERLAIERGLMTGLYLWSTGSTLTVSDLSVRDVQPDAREGLLGIGVFVGEGAHLTATRALVHAAQLVNVWVRGSGAQLDAAGLVIRDAQLPPCGGSPTCDGVLNTGLLVNEGGAAQADQFLITNNGGIGVAVATGGQIDLANGEVTFHQIGANVMIEGFDLARIQRNVRYSNNVQNLGALRLVLPPMPSPPAP